MGGTFSRVKEWSAGETLTAAQLNAEFDNILNNLNPAGIDDESASDAAAQASLDPYSGASLTKATSLKEELQQLRYLIAQLSGETYWYIDPDASIANLVKHNYLAKRSLFTYNGGTTAYTVKAKSASYWCKDKYCWWDEELTTGAIGTPAASDWYYLYLDYSAITSGTEITNSELIWSNTEPAWNTSYGGWYNSDDKCIFAVRTNAGPTNILEFYHDGGDLVHYAEGIEDVNETIDHAAFESHNLTLPKFCTKAATFIRWTFVDSAAYLRYKPKDANTTTGQIIAYAHTDGQKGQVHAILFTNGSQQIELEESAASDNTALLYTNGWYFPAGM